MALNDPDTAILRALSSKVRQSILDLLGRGPATATTLAQALGSNTGVTSYHLRELAKAGLIEHHLTEGRAQYWRVARRDVRFADPQASPLPALAQSIIDRRLAGLAASVDSYLNRTDLGPAWREAAVFSESALVLSSEELADFARAYMDLLRSWSDTAHGRSPDSTTRAVRLALFAFPDDSTTPRG
jgi:DNA-binding transcriptional ArsR family regulator